MDEPPIKTKLRQHFSLLILTAIPFFYYAYFRNDFLGYDTYQFAQTTGLPRTTLIGLAWIACWITSIALAETGQTLNPKHGWKAGYLAVLSEYYLATFMQIETETFAFAFFTIALCGFIYMEIKNKWNIKGTIASLISAGAGFMLWPGTSLIAWPFVVLYLHTFSPETLLLLFKPDLRIVESQFLGALLPTGLLWLGLIGWGKQHKTTSFYCLFYIIIGLISPKFAFLMIPYLALGLIQIKNKLLFQVIDYATITIILLSFIFILVAPPTTAEHQAIEIGIQKAKETSQQINNDWYLGHMINYYGGQTKSAYSPDNQQPFLAGEIIITSQALDCKPIGPFINCTQSYGKPTVYRC